MSAALTPPFLVASLVLCLAGALKLRAPAGAAGALGSLLADDQNRIFRSVRARGFAVRARGFGSVRARGFAVRARGFAVRARGFGSVRARRDLTGTGTTWAVRVLAVGEMVLGAACIAHPTRPLAAALALVYAMFATVAVMLMRRRAACGCFGDSELPVSLAHVLATGLLATLALAAALVGPGGLGWLLARPAPEAAVLLIGIAGALCATVLVYTELPRAWAAWSGE